MSMSENETVFNSNGFLASTTNQFPERKVILKHTLKKTSAQQLILFLTQYE
jgi:hypothetical protein